MWEIGRDVELSLGHKVEMLGGNSLNPAKLKLNIERFCGVSS